MRFECDERKSKQNLAKHEIDFQTAKWCSTTPMLLRFAILPTTRKKSDTSLWVRLGPARCFSWSIHGSPTGMKKSFG